ncbi:MAG TPA: tetratricopeptide repeat protein [Opitutaceae bacterium]|nr:tetratricopeptide repeat protein [Opitutaceae bacterium]
MKRLAGLSLVGLTWLAYWPVWQAGYVWNDADYVTRPPLRSLAGLWRIWSQPGATEQYYPLLHSAFWLEHRLWHGAPLGYHLVNVALHSLSALLFWLVLSRVFARVDGAGKAPPAAGTWQSAAPWLAAALFAVHPVMVESVAWISEQKNTLSLVFYLLAARAYLQFAWEGRRRGYGIGLAWFVCALLSKTVTATLPAALLVLLWWTREPLAPAPKGGSGFNHWLRLGPWLVLGAAAGLFSGWVERTYVGASGSGFSLSFLQRALLAARIPWFYLGKLLWPAHLVFIYPHWEVRPAAAEWWLYLAMTLGVSAGGVVLAVRRGWLGPLATWLLFVGGLFPTLGFFNVYAFIYSYVADHWNYVSALPVFAAAAWLLVRAFRALPAAAGGAAAVGLLAALGVRAAEECRTYRDVDVFYRTIIARNPGAWMAENNLATLLVDAHRFAEAVPYLDASLRAWPNAPVTLLNRGVALHGLGRLQPAMDDLTRALQLEPDFPLARRELAETENDAGAAAINAGDTRSAGRLLNAAIHTDPKLAIAWANYGRVLIAVRNLDAARRALEEAIRLQPDFPEAENDLGAVLARQGRPQDAIPHYEAALRLRPDYPDARRNLELARRAAGEN